MLNYERVSWGYRRKWQFPSIIMEIKEVSPTTIGTFWEGTQQLG
jgi:hypothetical protein